MLTQPDRPSGRGLATVASAVKRLPRSAASRCCSRRRSSDEARAPLLAIPLDVLVVAAYGLILPPAVLSWPRFGCLNIHASLLPRWRGAAPIQHAILAGDAVTGVTIMQMDAGLDTGPMIVDRRDADRPAETAGALTERLAGMGADAIVATLERLRARARSLRRRSPPEGVTYAAKIDAGQAALDWSQPAVVLDRMVRAFDPVPGARFTLAGDAVKVWSAEVGIGCGPARYGGGRFARRRRCRLRRRALRLLIVQPAGGKRMSASAFAAGRRLAPGAR